MKYILNKDGTTKMTDYDYFCQKFGKDMVEKWLDEVEMEDLMDCMDAFSNNSFLPHTIKQHRDKNLNILEMILQETPNQLYPSVTYGVQPNTICTDAIGYLTGRKYGNLEIATFLIEEKISELKEWLLENYCFSYEEEKLLHFFKDRKGIFVDEFDSYFDNIDRFDFEQLFDNKSSHKKYIVVGKAERWNAKGYGYFDTVFDSILEAIDKTTDGMGIYYLKVYENNRGKLFVDVRHHDGYNEFEIRELTKKGEKRYNNADIFDEDIIKNLAYGKGYTKNVSFSKNY